ncbi:MAG: ArsR/SmtB family transcription factor [Halobacteriales archaeon]
MARLLPFRSSEIQREQPDPRLVEIDDESADEVFAALSSSTARRIIAQLYEEPTTASELAEAVDTSLQNVRYHLENLQDAGLVEIVDTWYSSRGTEMKVYAPTNDPLVVAAGQEESTGALRGALKRLLGAIGVLGIASLVLDQGIRTLGVPGPTAMSGGGGGGDAGAGGSDGGGDAATTDQGVELAEVETEAQTATATPTETPTPMAETEAAGAASTPTQTPVEPATEAATETVAATGTPTPRPTAEPATETAAATGTPTPTSTPAPTPTETELPQADTANRSVELTEQATETAFGQPTPISGAADGLAALGSPGAYFFAGGLLVILLAATWWYWRHYRPYRGALDRQ